MNEFYRVFYDTPNGRPHKDFREDADAHTGAENRAWSFAIRMNDQGKHPKMVKITEEVIRSWA